MIQGHDHPFRQVQLDRLVSDHQGVEVLVHIDSLTLQHRPNQVHHLLGFGIGEVERPDHEVLILLLLGFGIRDDEERVGPDAAGHERIGVQNQVQRLIKRQVFNEDRDRIIFHLFVEHHIEGSGSGQDLEHLLQLRALEPQRDRLAGPAESFRRPLAHGRGRDAVQRLRQTGIEFDGPLVGLQRFIEPAQVAELVSRLQLLPGLFQPHDVAHRGVVFPLSRIQSERQLELLQGFRNAVVLQVSPSFGVMLLGRACLRVVQPLLQSRIMRILPHGFAIRGHCAVPVSQGRHLITSPHIGGHTPSEQTGQE